MKTWRARGNRALLERHWLLYGLIFVVFSGFGCATSSSSPQDTTSAQQSPEPKPAMEQVASLIPEQTLLLVGFGTKDLEQAAELSGNEIVVFFLHDLSSLEGLDKEARHFTAHTSIGYDEILSELSIGTPVTSASAVPRGTHERNILAADDIDLLRQSLEKRCRSEFNEACDDFMVTSEVGNYLVIDFLYGEPLVRVSQWDETFSDALPDVEKTLEATPTPAWNGFQNWSSEHGVSAYAKTSEFIELMAILDMHEVGLSLGDPQDQRFWIHELVNSQLTLFLDSPHTSEFYDIAAHVSFTEKHVSLDTVASLTPYGRELQSTATESVTMAPPTLDDSQLSGRWVFDTEQAVDSVRRPAGYEAGLHSRFSMWGFVQYPRTSMALLLKRWEKIFGVDLATWRGISIDLAHQKDSSLFELVAAFEGREQEQLVNTLNTLARLNLREHVKPMTIQTLRSEEHTEVHIATNGAGPSSPREFEGLELRVATEAMESLFPNEFPQSMSDYANVIWRSISYDDQWRASAQLGPGLELPKPAPIEGESAPAPTAVDPCVIATRDRVLAILLNTQDPYDIEVMEAVLDEIEGQRPTCETESGDRDLLWAQTQWESVALELPTKKRVDRSAIQDVVRTHRDQIRVCYETALEDEPHLSGRVTVKFVVAEDGQVAEASVRESDLNSVKVEECMIEHMESWDFSSLELESTTTINYPFNFST